MPHLAVHPAPVIVGHSGAPPDTHASAGRPSWTLELGTIAGVAVRVHATFLLVVGWLALAAWTSAHTITSVVETIAFILAVFACIVLHELGHALMARVFGISTRDITLYAIGGVGRLERIPDVPIQELGVALAGPMISVAIAAALLLGYLLSTGTAAPVSAFAIETAPFVVQLGVVNVALAVFNLLPSFPMDGGRVLRALLAFRLGYTRATEIAAVIGRGMALLFGAVGLMSSSPVLVLVAVFVWFSGSQEERAVRMMAALRGIPVSAAMRTSLVSLAPDDTLDRASALAIQGSQRDFPVVRNETIVGILTGEGLRRGLSTRGPSSLVADAMQTDVEAVDADELVVRVLARLDANGRQTVPVAAQGRLAGLFSIDDLDQYLRLRAARAAAHRRGGFGAKMDAT